MQKIERITDTYRTSQQYNFIKEIKKLKNSKFIKYEPNLIEKSDPNKNFFY